MKKELRLASTLLLLTFGFTGYAQCADDANVYSFEYDGRTYQVVRENRTWIDAAACAVETWRYSSRN